MESVLKSITAEELQAVVLSEALQANDVFHEGTTIIINRRGSGEDRHFYVQISRPEEADA